MIKHDFNFWFEKIIEKCLYPEDWEEIVYSDEMNHYEIYGLILVARELNK